MTGCSGTQSKTADTETADIAKVLETQDQDPQVTTKNGVLEGLNQSGLSVFLGVPFAQAPVGDLRWKAPQPVKNWDGVRQAKEYGANPMQQPVFGDMAFGTKEMSEDCLYLNIWSPAKSATDKLPILIYFNGGGLYAGSGSEPRYAGDALARKGNIICVTANYREGIFGFYANPELSAETDYKGSGNYGFLDQRAAIKWIKDNISAFGGDPEQITIVGESAGSMSVSAQIASPLNEGLFARAMASSGSIISMKPINTLEQAENNGVETMKSVGCKNIAEMRAMPAEELMNKVNMTSANGYNIDNYFFTEQPYDTYKNGRQMKVPLLVGGNSQELPITAFTQGKTVTINEMREICKAIWGENGAAMFDAYGFNTDEELQGMKGAELSSDLFLSYSTWKFGNMHKKTSGQPVYRYLYCHPRPEMRDNTLQTELAGGTSKKKEGAPEAPKMIGAVHSADIEYAMATLPTNRIFDWQAEDYIVSDQFSQYYINFVKTGNPNGNGLATWLPTNAAEVEPVMQIDVKSFLKQDPDLEQRYATFDKLNWKE